MMTPDGAMLLLLPVCCLLSRASWAATLSGLGGECHRHGGGKQKLRATILAIGSNDQSRYDKKADFFLYRQNFSLFDIFFCIS